METLRSATIGCCIAVAAVIVWYAYDLCRSDDELPHQPTEGAIFIGKNYGETSKDRDLVLSSRGFPNPIHLGDTLYMQVLLENTGQQAVSCFPRVKEDIRDDDRELFLTYGDRPEKYVCLPESRTSLFPAGSAAPPEPFILGPGRSVPLTVFAVKLPPLEDLESPFWKKALKQIADDETASAIALQLHVRCSIRLIGEQETVHLRLVHSIDLMNRPAPEENLLRRWYEETDRTRFPIRAPSGANYTYKTPPANVQGTEASIVVSGVRCSPDLFIPVGNRTPPADQCPTTSQGWRNLEASLSPSTMRDEIRLTRLIIELMETRSPDSEEEKCDEIVSWVAALSPPQRMVMASYQRSGKIWQSPFSKKYHRLREALSPFRFIPADQASLPGVVALTTPTEDDLNLKKEDAEPEDGFRVWHCVNDRGEESDLVARFVEFTDDGVRLHSRGKGEYQGNTFEVPFRKLQPGEIEYLKHTYPKQFPASQ